MTVCDLTGKKVYACEGFESSITLNVDGGIFFLHVDLGTTTTTERLIISN
jgi:hypothetical protein